MWEVSMGRKSRKISDVLNEDVMVRQCVGLSEHIKRFTADASGATAIEYSLIVVGIALAIVVSVGLLGGALNLFFSDLQASIADM